MDETTTQDEAQAKKLEPIDISQFEGRPGKDGSFGFGLGTVAFATALRQMADRVERGEVLVQRVHVIGMASMDDYTTKRLVLQIVERRVEHPLADQHRAYVRGEPLTPPVKP